MLRVLLRFFGDEQRIQKLIFGASAVCDRLSLTDLVHEMKTINIHQAKTQLSRLVDEASKGEPFVIAKAGKPLVKVTALGAPLGAEVKRLGFMAGRISVPDDFDRMGEEEIVRLFTYGTGRK